MKANEMNIRSWLILLLTLGLIGFLSFQNSAARGGQSGSIGTYIKLKRIQLIALTVGGDDIWSSVTTSDPVKPYKTAAIALIRLDDWYDKLPAGHYHLIAKYRITNSKEMEIAASTEFFVVP